MPPKKRAVSPKANALRASRSKKRSGFSLRNVFDIDMNAHYGKKKR